eukprot:scaffold11768_cov88-Skeletonema_dohrnii-CCMP3373.AAC.1
MAGSDFRKISNLIDPTHNLSFSMSIVTNTIECIDQENSFRIIVRHFSFFPPALPGVCQTNV